MTNPSSLFRRGARPGLRLLVLVAALAAAVLAPALTVATWNVENYNLADRLVDGTYRKAYPKPEEEKAAVRRAVKAIAPDILAMQEMGGAPFLAELQRDLEKDGVAMPHAVVLEAADPDRHVAILSKLPFKAVQKHVDVPVTLFGKKDVVKRGALEVTFSTSEGDLTVFVIHLKSKRTERPDDPEGAVQREREAEAVRDLVLARFPDGGAARYIVCGDFNDTRSSKPVQSLLKRGKTELGEMLRAADAQGETWTHFYRREDTYSRIDYLIVSRGLKPLVEGGKARIFDGVPVGDASDHRPVFVKLKAEAAK